MQYMQFGGNNKERVEIIDFVFENFNLHRSHFIEKKKRMEVIVL